MRGESRWYGKLYANCCAFAWSFMISVVWSHSSNHSPPAVLSKVDTMPPLPTSSLSKFCQVAFQNKCQSHPKHQTFTCPSNCTYPFSIMVQWKITPNERKLIIREPRLWESFSSTCSVAFLEAELRNALLSLGFIFPPLISCSEKCLCLFGSCGEINMCIYTVYMIIYIYTYMYTCAFIERERHF